MEDDVKEKAWGYLTCNEVQRMQQKLSVFNKPATTLPFSVANLLGNKASIKEKIWRYLTCNEVQIIGVCGIAGVGKTTIMKHIYNELLSESRFDKVIWVTVSYPLNVMKLQYEIAKEMNESLPENENEQRRASRLMQMMGKVKYVLILVDVGECFTLKDVGIPSPTMENGCKLVITSISVEVCMSLSCNIVKVEPLSQQDSMNLFLNHLGREILEIPELEGILKLMVNECVGLPLAIILTARSMKGVSNVHEWILALNELRECEPLRASSEDKIFKLLKFSYSRLQDSNIQNCFLSCSLYPEVYSISKNDLVEQWIDEGLIEELGSRQAMLDKGQTILNRLEDSRLLFNNSKDFTKMHDSVRDMALRLKSIGPHFMVKARMGLRKIPDEHEWAENVEKVSLMQNEISDIPLFMSPSCPNLTTLMFQENEKLTQIPDCFFANMPGLKFLNLSQTSIKSLPNSISNLKNLSALLLRFCKNLKDVPCLANLKALKKLDLFGAGIEVVPGGIEVLVNLQYLDLWCPNLVELQTGMLSNLSCLQHLVVYWNSNTLRIKVEDIVRLEQLETFEGKFYDLHEFNNYVKSNHYRRLSHYVLVVGQVEEAFSPSFSKTVSLGECEIGGEDILVLPDDMQELWIYRCRKFRSFGDISSLRRSTKLRKCVITRNEEDLPH